ncbi:MAG TPA: efflux RND transporter periplasmic adaptor subunit [Thermoanaerobaculia bacterium]|nr:efflux RND transporter periplasmic adaptor subunit [Thermoanaerobaculia bacterium]
MNSFSRSTLPWVLAAVFAAGFVTLAISRKQPAKPGAVSAASPHASPLTPHEKKILYWVDPMTPGYKSDKPGKSPFMDMDLVPVYEQGTGAPPAAGVEGYSTISVPQGRQQAIGVQLGKAESRELVKKIRTVGRVTFDETLHAQIHAKFEGYVERLYLDYTGKPVRKGQALLSIYSPELLATQEEYLIAFRARQQLRTSSNPDVAQGGVDLYDSAHQRLLFWDISPGEISELEKTGKPKKALTLYSPVDGFVVSKNAVVGARVMPADTLFEIAGIRRVWVLADVYESEAPFVALGQTARMSLSYLPGRTWTGKVSFIAPVLDEKTRTVQVRVEFENPDGILKPEMYADISLERPLGRVVTVPDGAVLSTGTRSVVFVAKGEGQFEPRTVTTGAKSDGFFEIREGIQAGEEVVTQANFLIDSESRLKSALGSMTGPAGQSHGSPPSASATGASSRDSKPATPPAHSH